MHNVKPLAFALVLGVTLPVLADSTQSPQIEVTGTVRETTVASQSSAEEIFASAEAALYLPEAGKVRWLAARNAAASSHVRTLAPVATLREFDEGVDRDFPRLAENAYGPWLMKRPASIAIAHPLPDSVPAEPQATVYSESFESGMGNWSVSNNTSDLYAWGVTSCAARTGAYSADAMRGGLNTLLCSDAYAANVTTAMVHKSCEAIAGASQAWLDTFILLGTESNADKLGFYYADSSGSGYGYEMTGTASSWFHLVFNLRQWYRVGDLTTASCPRLILQFYSNATTQSGIGARVDDITIGNAAPSFLTASINASPTAGTVPLTVSFTANVTGATSAATYYWSFGDASGTTATTPNATFTYTTAGDYRPRLIVTDSGARAFAQTTISATATPTCAVSCSASAPGSVAVGSSALFQATAIASGCSGTASYAWTFGDGQSSNAQNASHAYTAAGSYHWTLTTSIGGSSCTKSGTITVTSGTGGARRRAISSPPGIDQLATSTMGSGGGTLSAAGFTLSVPAGAFTSSTSLSLTRTARASAGDLSDSFAVEGLPQTLGADLSIAIDLPSAPSLAAGESLYISFGALALDPAGDVRTAPFLLPASASGRTVRATVPKAWGSPSLGSAANRGATPLAGGREVPRFEAKVVEDISVSNDHFKVTAPSTAESWARAALPILDAAYDRINALGFSWGCRQPSGGAFAKIPVHLAHLGTALGGDNGQHNSRLDPCGTGLIFTDYVVLNMDVDVASSEMRAAIGHEVFHTVLETYLPTTFMSPSNGLWIKEASTTWFETIFVTAPPWCPGVMTEGVSFAWRGLFNAANSATGGKAPIQNHGYGAAGLLKYKTDASSGTNDPFIHSLWISLKGGKSEYESLQNALGSSLLPEFWTRFSKDVFTAQAACSTLHFAQKAVAIKDVNSLPQSYSFKAYPLSSISHGFDLKMASLSTDTPLRLTASGLRDGQTVFVWSTKMKSEVTQLTKSVSTYPISDPVPLKGGYLVLTFVDSNLPAGSYESTNDVTISLTLPVSSWLIRAALDDRPCSIGMFASGTIAWPIADMFVAKWSGNSFSSTYSGTEAGDFGTTMSTQTSTAGSVAADRKKLDTFTFEYHSTQTFPASGQCPSSCIWETWESISLKGVPAADDWSASYLHYKAEGAAATPYVDRHSIRVRTSGWKWPSDNWDCTNSIDDRAPEDTQIDIVVY